MKRTIIILLLITGFLRVMAQEMTTPTLNYNALEKKMQKSDEAIKDEKAKMNSKTWFDRGELFQDINDVNTEFLRLGMGLTEAKLYKGEPKEILTKEEGGKKIEEYVYDRITLDFNNGVLVNWTETQVLHPEPLEVAVEAYKKALELDDKGKLDKKIKENLDRLKRQLENKAIMSFNDGNYAGSVKAFELILAASETRVYGGVIDTVVIYNTGLAARNAGDHKKAIEYFRKAIDLGYGGSDAYYLLKIEYIALKDSNMAIKTLEEGFQKYPDTTLILIEIVNYYLTSGNAEAGLKYLELAEEKETNNPSIYFAKGTLYERVGDKEKALQAYKQAIGVDSEYFNAYFNIGALYYNNAVELYDKANAIEDLKEYNKAKAFADEELKRAVEPMEKALEITKNSDSYSKEQRAVLETLQTVYYRLQMMEKYEAVKSELDKIKK